MATKLRPVSTKDMELLFNWVNDPAVRANSFNQQPVSWEEHQNWLHRKMASPHCHHYIVCQDDIPVGQLRLDIEDHTAYISYLVASQYRGQGLGTEILVMAKGQVPAGIRKLTGRVKPDNAASIKAFKRAGFTETECGDYIEFVCAIDH